MSVALPCNTVEEKVWTETEINGARFHRAEHVLHVRKTTVISAPVLIVP